MASANSRAGRLPGANAAGKSASTFRPFGAVLRDLLIERGFVTAIGNPNWSGFAMELEGVQYESLRKAVARERPPAPKIMEAVASKLGVSPSIFAEYELWEAQRQFDPREVGEDEALENLRVWSEARAASKPRRRSRS